LRAGHKELVEFLVSKKASPMAQNKKGQTAVDLAKGAELKQLLKEAAEQQAQSEPEPVAGPAELPAAPDTAAAIGPSRLEASPDAATAIGPAMPPASVAAAWPETVDTAAAGPAEAGEAAAAGPAMGPAEADGTAQAGADAGHKRHMREHHGDDAPEVDNDGAEPVAGLTERPAAAEPVAKKHKATAALLSHLGDDEDE